MIKQKVVDFINAEKTVLLPKGYNLWTCFIQAFHETGGFAKVIGKNNYWGIKKPLNWTGIIHTLYTKEWEPNVDGDTPNTVLSRVKKRYGTGDVSIVGKEGNAWIIRLPQAFIDFDTAELAIAWWDGLVQRLYRDAYAMRKNPPKFWEKLVDTEYDEGMEPQWKVEPQWATDLKYTDNLNAVYGALKQNVEICKLIEIPKRYDEKGNKII